MRFLIRWFINAIALGLAARLFDGIWVDRWETLIPVALIFGLINAFLGPLLKILTCPLIVLTLGLFALVVNALLLQLTSWAAGRFGLGFGVEGFWTAFFGAIVIAVVSVLLSLALPDPDRS